MNWWLGLACLLACDLLTPGPICFKKIAGHTWYLPYNGATVAASGSQAGTSSGGGEGGGGIVQCRRLPRSMKGNSLARWPCSANSSRWENMLAFWLLTLFCPSGSFRTRIEDSWPKDLGRSYASASIGSGQWGGSQFWATAPIHITSGDSYLTSFLAGRTQSLWRTLPFSKQLI